MENSQLAAAQKQIDDDYDQYDREQARIEFVRSELEKIAIYLYSSTDDDHINIELADREILRLTGEPFDIADYLITTPSKYLHAHWIMRNEMNQADAKELASDITEHVINTYETEIINWKGK